MNRPPPPEPFTQQIQVYSRTDVGKRRQRNEDALGVIARHGLYIVADGMGGVDGGDYSSRRVVEDLLQCFQAVDPATISFWERLDRVCECINASSAGIRQEAEKRGISGMGTTVVVLCVDLEDPSRACALHVGDSRVYRFRSRSLKQVTRDHSLAAESGLDDSTPVPMFMAGVITRAVGVRGSVEVERTPVDVQPGDRFLLCSDGLYNMVPPVQLAAIFRNDVQDPSAQLIISANEAGGFDNITVIVLQIPGSPAPAGSLDETQM